jgi:hydrogenase-4 component B
VAIVSAWLVVAAIGLAAASGVPGLFLPRGGRAGERLAAVLLALAGSLGVAGGLWSLLGHPSGLDAPWAVPGGRLRLGVDALSAIFVVPIALVSGLGAIYGLGYWPQSAHPDSGRVLRACYGVLTAGLLLLVVARNVILFFAGWEMMALGAFLLITTEDRQASVREVGYVYILATRAGTLCLFAMFGLLFAATGSLDFDDWAPAFGGPLRDAIFVTGLVGFGLKAGLMPLHVWLPGAHASAPSHVSAQMSGVLIKVGIYGLVRITALCPAPPIWWGIALLVAGISSAVLGVGFAIGQHDLKRLLAYHSVENIGIICLGLGVAVLGRALARPELIALGLAGALLHVWNHSLFKSLLFLAAGSVLHATGTREIDRLGGLWRRMPYTGAAFLVGAIAICGLPPLNGLISELFVYLGLFRAAIGGGDSVWLVAMLAAAALAMVGALALACFVKAVGAVFLGAPRTAAGDGAHEAGRAMLVPMAVLAACCLAIGVGAPLLLPLLDEAIAVWSGGGAPPLASAAPVTAVAITSGALLVALAVVGAAVARRGRSARADVGTWDCGYAAASPRMQYTSSSFAAMLVQMLAWALRPDRHAPRLSGPFPGGARFESHVPDTVLDRALRPLFGWIEQAAGRLRRFQRGSIHAYLLYIVATLLVLLLWK